MEMNEELKKAQVWWKRFHISRNLTERLSLSNTAAVQWLTKN